MSAAAVANSGDPAVITRPFRRRVGGCTERRNGLRARAVARGDGEFDAGLIESKERKAGAVVADIRRTKTADEASRRPAERRDLPHRSRLSWLRAGREV